MATTDANGGFSFAVRPGRYSFVVDKTGFVSTTTFGAPPPPTVRVTDGESLDDLRLFLDRGALITGHVFDANGEPLSNARVLAERVRLRADSTRMFGRGAAAQANDLGEFRLVGLAAADYIVSAAPPRRSSAGVDPVVDQAMAATFYPAAGDRTRAQALTIASGQTLNGIDITLTVRSAFVVSGAVVDHDGKPVANLLVMLREPVPEPSLGPVGESHTDAGGRFHIAPVPPGRYAVHVGVPTTLRLQMKEAIDLRVTDASVTDLRIVLVPRP